MCYSCYRLSFEKQITKGTLEQDNPVIWSFGLNLFPGVKVISFFLCPRTFAAPCIRPQISALTEPSKTAFSLRLPHETFTYLSTQCSVLRYKDVGLLLQYWRYIVLFDLSNVTIIIILFIQASSCTKILPLKHAANLRHLTIYNIVTEWYLQCVHWCNKIALNSSPPTTKIK